MSASASGKSPVAQAGWLVALLFFGWLAFLLVPGPKPKPGPPPEPYVKPPNRLAAFGLPDNPDFEHLPEFFALFADKAEWTDDKTKFAYWHPGVQRYEYFFEATRIKGAFRFRGIPEIPDETLSLDAGDGSAPDVCPIRFYRSPPLMKETLRIPLKLSDPGIGSPAQNDKKLPDAMKPPPPELPLQPVDLKQRK